MGLLQCISSEIENEEVPTKQFVKVEAGDKDKVLSTNSVDNCVDNE